MKNDSFFFAIRNLLILTVIFIHLPAYCIDIKAIKHRPEHLKKMIDGEYIKLGSRTSGYLSIDSDIKNYLLALKKIKSDSISSLYLEDISNIVTKSGILRTQMAFEIARQVNRITTQNGKVLLKDSEASSQMMLVLSMNNFKFIGSYSGYHVMDRIGPGARLTKNKVIGISV